MDPQLLQSVLTPFATGASQWIAPILALGTPIFWMLSTIELMCVFVLMMVNHDIPSMTEDLVRSLIAIAVAYTLFINAADWMRNGVIGTLIEWGGLVSGFPADNLSPDGILQEGWTLAHTIFTAVGLGTALRTPLTTIVIMVLALAIFAIFTVAAVMLLKLLIDSYVVAIGCSIFLPIGAFRFTSHVIAHYVGAVLSVGLQLFFSLVILSIAQTLVAGWIFELTTHAGFITSNIEIPLQIAAEGFVFLVLLWTIPAYIGRLVVGAVIPGIGASGVGSLMAAALGGGRSAAVAAASGAGAVTSGINSAGSSSSQEIFAANLQSMLTTT
jgi:P-type conjugative transfer protein TrbL